MSVRKPKNSGTLKNIGKFPSLKNKKIVWFESLLERDFIYLIEFDKQIIRYEEQPFKIKYKLNQKSHSYTPDFLIERQNKKQIIEVKPQIKTEKEEFIVFSSSMKKLLASEGYEYLVVTDSTIRLQPKLSNIKLLWYYARIPISTRLKVLVHDFFYNTQQTVFSEFCLFLTHSKEQKELIYTFLFHGYLLIDISKPITNDSVISMGNISK